MDSRKLINARNVALQQKLIKNKDDLKISTRKGKRFMINTPSGWIHFGVYPFKIGTYLDHGNDKIREAWRARHSKIKLKNGNIAYKDPQSPEYYAWRILW